MLDKRNTKKVKLNWLDILLFFDLKISNSSNDIKFYGVKKKVYISDIIFKFINVMKKITLEDLMSTESAVLRKIADEISEIKSNVLNMAAHRSGAKHSSGSSHKSGHTSSGKHSSTNTGSIIESPLLD